MIWKLTNITGGIPPFFAPDHVKLQGTKRSESKSRSALPDKLPLNQFCSSDLARSVQENSKRHSTGLYHNQGKTIGENGGSMVVEWDFMGFTLGKLTWLCEITIFNGKWPCSIATLNHKRVGVIHLAHHNQIFLNLGHMKYGPLTILEVLSSTFQ